MILEKMECALEINVAEELATFLEEEALSVSWYEREEDQWTFQIVFMASEEENIQNKVRSFFEEKRLDLPDFQRGRLPKTDWVSAVYQRFPPLTIGKFYIYGTHTDQPLPKPLIPLCIDAASAFGSGQHESTEGCLKALSLLTEQSPFSHPLDMGCGSGILALAMARLWHVPVLACDNDPEAVRVTLKNAQVNGLSSLIQGKVTEGFFGVKEGPFDIITANILAGSLCHMAKDMHMALQKEGYCVLSGLLNSQAQDVIDAYRASGFKLVEQLFVKDWSTLILRKKNDG